MSLPVGDFAGLVAPVVVACSGGADSLALLALAVDAGLQPIAVHVDHGLRPGSAYESGVVEAAAVRLGAEFRARTVSVASGSNLEARARAARVRGARTGPTGARRHCRADRAHGR